LIENDKGGVSDLQIQWTYHSLIQLFIIAQWQL